MLRHTYHTLLFRRHFISSNLPTDIRKLQRGWKKKKDDRDISFLLIDIDFFKSIDDTSGHDFGDDILIQVSNILNSACRKGDWIILWVAKNF